MARMPDIKIRLGLSEVVRVYCGAAGCKHNMVFAPRGDDGFYCELKSIDIGADGKCSRYVKKEER